MTRPTPTFALESEDIRKTFGYFTALGGVTLRISRGEFVALFGRNGAGKTTLLFLTGSSTKGWMRTVEPRKSFAAKPAPRVLSFLLLMPLSALRTQTILYVPIS